MTGTQVDPGVGQAARGTMLNLAGAAVTTATGFATVILVTRVLGLAGAGVLFAGVGLWTLLANAAKIGTEASLTWFISSARAAGEPAPIRVVLRSALLTVALLSGALGLAGALASPLLARWLTDEAGQRSAMTALLVTLSLSLPTWSVAQAAFGASRGFATMRPSVVWGQIVRPTAQTVILAVTLLFSERLWLLGASWAASSVIGVVAALVWIERRVADLPAHGPDGRPRFWAYTRPRALADIIHSALERLDLLLVSALAGSAAAGSYAAGNRLILAGQLVMMALALAIAPHVAARLATGETDGAQSLIRTLTAWNVVVIWPLMLLLALGAPTIVSVFGDDFAGSANLVIVLAAGLLVVSALGPGDTVLMMTGDSRGSLWNHVLALVTMIAVAVVAIPVWGAIGAAWAWSMSRVVLRASAVWRIQMVTGVRCWGRAVAIAAAAAVVAYLPLGVVSRVGLGDGLAPFAVVCALGSAIYAALLWRLRRPLALVDLASIGRHRSR